MVKFSFNIIYLMIFFLVTSSAHIKNIMKYLRQCNLCKGKMIRKGIKIVGDTKYNLLECEKCKHIVARNEIYHE